jgi:hypothetical protein
MCGRDLLPPIFFSVTLVGGDSGKLSFTLNNGKYEKKKNRLIATPPLVLEPYACRSPIRILVGMKNDLGIWMPEKYSASSAPNTNRLVLHVVDSCSQTLRHII